MNKRVDCRSNQVVGWNFKYVMYSTQTWMSQDSKLDLLIDYLYYGVEKFIGGFYCTSTF